MKIFSDKLKVFFLNKINFFIFWAILLLNLTFVYILLRYIDFARESHVLHYNFYFGIDLLGRASNLWLVPVFGLGIFIINFFIGFAIYKKRENFFISNFLLLTSLFINIQFLMYLLGILSIEY